MTAKNPIGNPVVVAAVSKGIEKTKEKAAATKEFVIRNRKPIAYIAGGAVIYFGGRTLIRRWRKQQAMKSAEAKNANMIYLIIKDKLHRGFFSLEFSLDNLIDHIFPVETTAYETIRDKVAAATPKNKILEELQKLHVTDLDLLRKTYKGLWRRDLDKDLMQQSVLQDNQYYDLIERWQGSDIKNTGYKYEKNNSLTIIDHDGLRKNFKIGRNPSLANNYAVSTTETWVYLLSTIGENIKQTPVKIPKNVYLGCSTGLRFANQNIEGGLIFKSNDRTGIHLAIKVGDKTYFLAANTADIKMFSKQQDFMNYAKSKGVKIYNPFSNE